MISTPLPTAPPPCPPEEEIPSERTAEDLPANNRRSTPGAPPEECEDEACGELASLPLPKCPFQLEPPCSATLSEAMRQHLVGVVQTHLGPEYGIFVLEPAVCELIESKGSRTLWCGILLAAKTVALHTLGCIREAAQSYTLFSHSIKYPGYEEMMKPRKEIYLIATKHSNISNSFVQSILEANPPHPSGWIIYSESPKKHSSMKSTESGISRGIFRTDGTQSKAEQSALIDLVLPVMNIHVSHLSPICPISAASFQSISYRVEWILPYQNSTGLDTILLLLLFVAMAGVPWVLQILAATFPPS
jgi:hypothetical protein